MNPSAYETENEPEGSDPQGLGWAKEQLLDQAHLCCGHGQGSGFSGSLAGQREEQDSDFRVKRITQPHVRLIPPAPVQDQCSPTALELHQMHIFSSS